MKINEVMQAKRKEMNMTQNEMAQKLDVSDKTVSRWELGVSYPNVDMIPKIASLFRISINELFGDGVAEKEFCLTQTHNNNKINEFKIFFAQFLICSIISFVMYIISIAVGGKAAWILFVIATVIFIASAGTYFIYRAQYSLYYKNNSYQCELKKIDAKFTVIVFTLIVFILQLSLLPLLLVNLKLLFLLPLLTAALFAICMMFYHKLGYKVKMKSTLFIITAVITASVLILISLISFMIGSPVLVDSYSLDPGTVVTIHKTITIPLMPIIFITYIINMLILVLHIKNINSQNC